MTSIRKRAKRTPHRTVSPIIIGAIAFSPTEVIRIGVGYGFEFDCGNVVHPHPPTISNVRRIAGEGVTEQDHIKVLAANVMYRNMLVMGDI